MAERNVKVTFGKITLSHSGGTIATMKVTPPFAKTSAATSGKAGLGGKSYSKATRHDIGGGFSTVDVIHPDGTVILVQAARTLNGLGYANAGIFLRLRETAAMIVIKAKLPHGPESILGDQIIAFSGCADVMTPEQLKSLDVEVPRSYISNYMAKDETDELFEIQTIRAESQPAPNLVRIATSEGVVLKAMAAEPVRRVRIRRS
jgi:hypothetical protein